MQGRFSEEMVRHYMGMALAKAESALRLGEFPVGCVIVDGKEVVASGSREGSTSPHPNETDHAEIMALRSLNRLNADIDPSRLVIFSTLEPCLMCYGAVLLSGIREIVYAFEDVMGGGTQCRLDTLPPLYTSRSTTIIAGVRRNESIDLFQRYFSHPDNDYWRGSQLADYTLKQP